jgi:hypothetical protein
VDHARPVGGSAAISNKQLTTVFTGLIAIGCLVGILVPAGAGWDFANFYDAGRRLASGEVENLYAPRTFIAGAPPQGTQGFFGAPISAYLYRPLGGLSVPTAMIVFKIQNVAALAGFLAVLFGFYRRFVDDSAYAQWQFAATFTGLSLIYQPFWTIFRVGGQTTPTAALLLALGLVFHVRDRTWWSAALVLAACLVKPALVLLLGLLLATSGRGFFWKTAAVAGMTGLVSLALMGWTVHRHFLELLLANQGTWTWHHNSSLFIVLDNVRLWMEPVSDTAGIRSVFASLTHALQAAALSGVTLLAMNARRQRWRLDAWRHFTFLLAILFFLLASRTIWEHYLTLLFIPLTFVVATARHFSHRARNLVWAIFALSPLQSLILTNWLSTQFNPSSLPALTVIAAYKSGLLTLTVLLLVRHRREIFRAHAVWLPAGDGSTETLAVGR